MSCSSLNLCLNSFKLKLTICVGEGRVQHFLFKIINVQVDLWMQEASAREVLLYIHGYNLNRKDAIKQAAQLKHYLKFKGLVIVYSWLSNGMLWGYKHDEKLIEKSAPWLCQFITTLLTKVWIRDPNILQVVDKFRKTLVCNISLLGKRLSIEQLCSICLSRDCWA